MDKLEAVKKKIIGMEELPKTLVKWHFQSKKVVFTNGCFDILHRGHVEYLAKASSLGDVLIVGLNSDESVRRLKGTDRPVQNEQTRSLILASLQFVHAVILFGEDTPYNLINTVKPNILVKGADYKAEEIVGFDIVKEYGGKIATIDLVQGHSTTGIIKKLNRKS